MGIKEKIANAKDTTWLIDALSADEQEKAKLLGDIAASIQDRRRELGYTQKDLANKLGVSQVMISRWENGDENFTVSTLARISAALNMPLNNPNYNFSCQ
jgi:ribosome-binding protein aMBF1 (putative translation factor)